MNSKNSHQNQVYSLLKDVDLLLSPTKEFEITLPVLRKMATDVAAVRDLLEAKKPEPRPRTCKRRYVLDMIESEKQAWIDMCSSPSCVNESYLEGVVDALEDLAAAFGSEEGDPLDE